MTAKRTASKKTSKKKPAAKKKAVARKKPVSKKKATKKKAMAKKAPAKKSAVKKKVVAKKSVKKKKSIAKAAPKKVTKSKAVAKTSVVQKKPAAKKAKVVKKAKAAPPKPKLNLRKFREQLRKKHHELMQAHVASKGDTRQRDSDGTEDYIDYAVNSYDREFMLSLTELEQNQLDLIGEALQRIDDREYGNCIQCERPIPVKRLEVQPWARYCLRSGVGGPGLCHRLGRLP
jgi:DnaK suppressor protein